MARRGGGRRGGYKRNADGTFASKGGQKRLDKALARVGVKTKRYIRTEAALKKVNKRRVDRQLKTLLKLEAQGR